MGFGMLRVLNDDLLAPGAGFDAHPHDNMEIISVPLEGRLEHRDSLGNHGIVQPGEVQIISAGTGIFHSEYNPDPNNPVHFLQIWILPQRRNQPPAYQTFDYRQNGLRNEFMQVLSTEPGKVAPTIRQLASMHIGHFDQGKEIILKKVQKGYGIFLFLIKGKITIFEQELDKGDAIGISVAEKPSFLTLDNCHILLLQIPMNQVPE
jgi:redox-sensitive bicupin YhaK (pirin superfamily)